MTNDDMELVREYAASQSERAFETLVSRHINLVYSTALRQVGDPHLTEEITQAVFIILALKAGSLDANTILPSWLHRTAGFAAADALKARRRRMQREQEAYMQSLSTQPDSEVWEQIAPLLDTAIAGLNDKDRHAIVLRFFQHKSLNEIGDALGASEEAAKKRVNRALEKLRKFFFKRGVNSTTVIFAGTISANSVQVAPAAMAKSVTAAAMAKGSMAAAPTLTAVKGALKIMAWTKAKTAIAVSAGTLLAAATATLIIKENTSDPTPVWQDHLDMTVLDGLRPQVTIRPALSSRPGRHFWEASANGNILAFGHSVEDLAMVAYPGNYAHLIFTAPVPPEKYDYISNIPGAQKEGLQRELKQKFGLVGRRETIETNVAVLTVRTPNAPGLKRGNSGITYSEMPDNFSSHGQDIMGLVDFLRRDLGVLVIDRTGLTNSFDIDLRWDSTPDGLKRELLDKLGLELTPKIELTQFYVVEKAK